MPDPITLPPVPAPLTSYFRAGGIKELLSIAERVGTGLPLINEYRRIYPRDPQLSQNEYLGLLGYLNTTAKFGMQAASQIGNLGADYPLSDEYIPKDFFLKPKNALTDKYLLKFDYDSVNPITGQRKQYNVLWWTDTLNTIGEATQRFLQQLEQFLSIVAASAKAGYVYTIDTASVVLTAVFRR
jgi:hypothetical protein